jgi:flagellar biosynthetic protein FliP
VNNRRLFLLTLLGILVPVATALAQQIPIPSFNFGIGEAGGPKQVALTLETLALVTVLTLAPSIIMMTTSFIRISIVFMFISRALSTQQIPPNQVVMALSVFLTIFVMSPTLKEVNDVALKPYFERKISVTQMYDRGIQPVRKFMFKQTRTKDLGLFMKLSGLQRPKNRDDIPTYALIPAFMISELKTAFTMGVALFIPFVVIDLVVASVLMSMGMIMLPPVMISLPLKIIVFVLADGWHLLTWSVVRSFQ